MLYPREFKFYCGSGIETQALRKEVRSTWEFKFYCGSGIETDTRSSRQRQIQNSNSTAEVVLRHYNRESYLHLHEFKFYCGSGIDTLDSYYSFPSKIIEFKFYCGSGIETNSPLFEAKS